MQLGDLGARFEVVRPAGSGGMGTVYQAVDRHSGRTVALKLLREGHGDVLHREAEMLQALRHPGLVRYVDHGVSADGQAFIAMEWVDGPSLAERMASRPLTRNESLLLLGRAADALAAAHDRGVVHRDIKPQNLVLAGGRVERVKLIDFGIAQRIRTMGVDRRLGRVAGTAVYMAPEQARGASDVDARADVFALGCVLFECLTGQLPWHSGTLVGDDLELEELAQAAQAQIDRARRLSEILPDVSAGLDALCARMLASERDERPPHAAAVSRALEALCEGPGASLWPGLLGGGELRLASVVLARAAEGLVDPRGAAAALAEAAGARVARAGDGALMAVFAGEAAASDYAASAARCALAMRGCLPADVVTVCTGRAELLQGELGGTLGERARAVCERTAATPGAARSGVRLDDASARLLGGRFDVCSDAAGAFLVCGEGRATERTLLGKRAPFVGREAELARLTEAYRQCAHERRAQAWLVVAETGMGKSRLADELIDRLDALGAEVWRAEADPQRQGSPYGLVAELARRMCGLRNEEPLAVRRSRLIARLSRCLPPARAARAALFLGEVAGTPFDDEDDRELAAARRDAVLMGDQIRRALEELALGFAARQPLVVCVDDLQWADRPSVEALDRVLAAGGASPLMVVALARPSVRPRFPDLWHDQAPVEIELPELAPAEAESFARQVLGAGAPAKEVARLGGGNPLFIEELVREVARRGAHEPRVAMPESVVLMAQARVSALEADARRVLRAASVYGAAFSHEGVTALLGAERAADVADWLEELAQRELLSRRGAAGFPCDIDYAFRHAVMREAAYATLTPADRQLGHFLAAAWLEASGETDAFVIAEHYALGGKAALAVPLYERAAEQAIIGNDFDGAIARVEQGTACGASGADLGGLRLREAQAHEWRGDNAAMQRCALEATRLLPRSDPRWGAAAAQVSVAAQRLGAGAEMGAIGEALDAELARGEPGMSLLLAAAAFVDNAYLAGLDGPAGALLGRLERVDFDDPLLTAHLHVVRAWSAYRDGSIGCAPDFYEPAAEAFELAGDRRRACLARTNAGSEYAEVGAYADARRVLAQALETALSMGLRHVEAHARHNLGLVLARLGDVGPGRLLEEQAVASALAQQNRRFECQSRIYLSLICWLAGDFEQAEDEAARAAGLEGPAPGMRAYALGALARARVSLGHPGVAVVAAEEAMALLDELGHLESGESIVRLSHAEALFAAGAVAAAQAAIGVARARIEARADRLRHARWRPGFLHDIAENARTLALAEEWA